MTEPETIVAEISVNWIDGTSRRGHICRQFEGVIEANRGRGYELASWSLSRVVVPVSDETGNVAGVALNETIIAVFTRRPM